MSGRKLYIAAYDVADGARLRHALKALRAHASGGQLSVFECFLTPEERLQLVRTVREILDLDEDRFLLVSVARGRNRTLGVAVPPDDGPFFYVG